MYIAGAHPDAHVGHPSCYYCYKPGDVMNEESTGKCLRLSEHIRSNL